ncbi:uncharacterized protein LOC116201810 isoform X2 [Punica granatum]|uniref:Uncharacterized protein LOC116201810 isoform X2 n=1 Tax=Punica granatum TaxID=22663 RepID=A0A6P8DCS6_PUNGR|nr:uncharacterized protein LOC116201810 isoform X2 [Punica granatum]
MWRVKVQKKEPIPCSSAMELSQKKKASRLVDSKESKPLSSRKDMTDRSGKQHNAHFSSNRHSQQHRQNLSRPIYLKRSRHHYGHQHHWRNSGTYFRPSTSHGKGSSWDEKLSFKMANPDYGHYTDEGERAFSVPEIIIRSNSADTNSGLLDPEKIACGICHNLLKRRPLLAPSAGEYAVVAVLVCGHLYHADCLEHKTPPQEKSDPPCPVCLGSSVRAGKAITEIE